MWVASVHDFPRAIGTAVRAVDLPRRVTRSVNAEDGFTYRTCSTFPNGAGEIIVHDVSQGAGRKITAKNGIATPCP